MISLNALNFYLEHNTPYFILYTVLAIHLYLAWAASKGDSRSSDSGNQSTYKSEYSKLSTNRGSARPFNKEVELKNMQTSFDEFQLSIKTDGLTDSKSSISKS